jgi:hypothetical protein
MAMPFAVPLHQAATCVNQSFSCFNVIDWFNAIDWFNDIDWFNELRLVGTAVLMTSVM